MATHFYLPPIASADCRQKRIGTKLKTTFRNLQILPAFFLALRAFSSDFAIHQIDFISGHGRSTDGTFAVSGAIKSATVSPMSNGDFAITGEFRSVIDANLLPVEELIVNGGFENIAGTFVRDGNGLMSLPAGSTAIPGWTVTTAEAAWGDNTNVFNVHSPFGGFFLDLTGYHDFVPYGGLTQTISTVPGRKYRLSLSIGSHASFGGKKVVSVCAGSAATVFIFSPTNAAGNQWGTFSFTFTAADSSTEIAIHAITGGAYLGLDNVSVVRDYSATSAGPQNLVVNGSFETGCPASFVSDANGVMSLPPGSTVIPGWTTTTAEILWGLNANSFGPQSPYGSIFLDLTGYHDSPPYGGVTQTIATSPDQSYLLTFSLGAHQDIPPYRGPMTVAVTAGSSSNSFTFTPAGAGNQWGAFSMEFIAESTATPLTFTGTASAGGAHLGLDNVSVIVSPEPLRLTAVSFAENELRFEIPPNPIQNFVVEGRADLTTGAWLPVPNFVIQDNGGIREVIIETDPDTPRQFYRVRRSP